MEDYTEVESDDHDWKCEKIVSSVTGDLNIGANVVDSIFSDGKDGHGYHYVALNDRTLC